MSDRCPDCGRSYALVGRSHRCVPRAPGSNATPVANVSHSVSHAVSHTEPEKPASRMTAWRQQNRERARTLHREYMRKRRAEARLAG